MGGGAPPGTATGVREPNAIGLEEHQRVHVPEAIGTAARPDQRHVAHHHRRGNARNRTHHGLVVGYRVLHGADHGAADGTVVGVAARQTAGAAAGNARAVVGEVRGVVGVIPSDTTIGFPLCRHIRGIPSEEILEHDRTQRHCDGVGGGRSHGPTPHIRRAINTQGLRRGGVRE